MLRLIIILFLAFGIPIIPNAAGIYDNSLTNIDKKKLEDTKANEINYLNGSPIKTTSEYEIELMSILNKNALIRRLEDKSLTQQKSNLAATENTNLFMIAPNNEIDAQYLLVAEMDWVEIKSGLNNINKLLNAFDRWTTHFLDEYLSQNINTNLVLVNNIKQVNMSNDNLNFYEQKRLSRADYKNNENIKYEEDSYKTSSGYHNGSNNAYESDSDKKNILSIIYLWRKYSDTIVVLSIIASLWLAMSSFIKYLTRNG